MNFRVTLSLFLIVASCFGATPGLAETNSLTAPSAATSTTNQFNLRREISNTAITLLMIFVFIALLILGLIGFSAACAMAAALAAFGIVSSSVAVGFIRRSPASGLRVLILQLGALAGIPFGIGGIWVVDWLVQSQWSIERRLGVGTLCGIICGVAAALVFNVAWTQFARWLFGKCEQRRHAKELTEG